MKASVHFVENRETLPRRAYVFPPLRLDGAGRPIDALAYRLNAEGTLDWFSPAPQAAEIQRVIQNKLKSKGFTLVSFQELSEMDSSHAVSVLNPYFTEARAASGEADGNEGWTAFVRVTAASFPFDLNPLGKKDLMNQEVVTLFKEKESSIEVVKRSSEYLLDFMGQRRQWSDSISLLD